MSIQKLGSENAWTAYDFDPDATTLTAVGWVDMRDYENILIKVQKTVGTSAVVFKVYADSDSAGGGTPVLLATSSSDPAAVGDYAFLEVNAEQIAAAGADYRYVSAYVSVATGTDEMTVDYLRGNAKRKAENLCVDSIA